MIEKFFKKYFVVIRKGWASKGIKAQRYKWGRGF